MTCSPQSSAARFVAQLKQRIERGAPIRASALAREIDPAVTWEMTDCNTMIFYSFSDGSMAGTKPAKPLAMRKGKKYQAWVVEPEHIVNPEDACPNCGERDIDRLVWIDAESETVRCATCGTRYEPNAAKGGDHGDA